MKRKKQEIVTLKKITTISKIERRYHINDNSFKKNTSQSKLFNIKTGFMATKETGKYEYLLPIFNDEKMKRDSFTSECAEN